MDASRTHEQTQAQPSWLFVAIGVVVLLIAALAVGAATSTDDVVLKEPVGPAVQVNAGAPTRIHPPANFAGAFADMRTGAREGGDTGAIPAGTPTTQDGVSEGPVYAGPQPGHGACPVKQQCG